MSNIITYYIYNLLQYIYIFNITYIHIYTYIHLIHRSWRERRFADARHRLFSAKP